VAARGGRAAHGLRRGRDAKAGAVKIAVDARELHGAPTGVGRYLAEILGAWRALPEAAAHQIVLCAPEGDAAGTAWEQLTLPRLVRRADADVLFAPAYTAPLRSPVPTVLTVHDVSFSAHPEWFSPREGFRRRLLTRLAARRAARVITVSAFSKGEIVRHLRVPPDKVEVIYSGLRALAPAPPATARERGTVLFVGSVFNRRHVPALVAGFARLAARRPGLTLEIVGDNRTTPRIDLEAIARASGAGERVHLRSYVSDEDLARLYASAGAFAFLSDYEGFGFTPLEALAAGLPPVVLDTPVAREIYDDAALYVARPDPPLVEAALETALFDEAARARVLAAAPAVLQRYSWVDAARRTLAVLVACAG
jgi:glycosyltransferase involved in cell wall biosynthesis